MDEASQISESDIEYSDEMRKPINRFPRNDKQSEHKIASVASDMKYYDSLKNKSNSTENISVLNAENGYGINESCKEKTNDTKKNTTKSNTNDNSKPKQNQRSSCSQRNRSNAKKQGQSCACVDKIVISDDKIEIPERLAEKLMKHLN